jgi:hypothetical protein
MARICCIAAFHIRRVQNAAAMLQHFAGMIALALEFQTPVRERVADRPALGRAPP